MKNNIFYTYLHIKKKRAMHLTPAIKFFSSNTEALHATANCVGLRRSGPPTNPEPASCTSGESRARSAQTAQETVLVSSAQP